MISVVIPLYNKEHTVLNCIHSVLNQSFTQFELLVVNDGSTDNSVNEVSKIADERIRIVHKTNGGVSSARNLGIELASFEFVSFLDADDSWEPNYLEEVVNLIHKNPNCCLYGVRQFQLSQKGEKFLSASIGDTPIYFFHKTEYFEYAQISILFHASAITVNKQRLGLHHIQFDTILKRGEDLDFYFRIALVDDMIFLNKPLTYYNLDVEGSAMKSPCDIRCRLIGNISRYKCDMEKSLSVRKFFSEYILSCLPLLIMDKVSYKIISELSSLIDVRTLPLSKRLFYYLPNFMKSLTFKLFKRQ
ncbi:glycosyltransferase family 2 protein [uncultured Bacteroides sp.]|uniref:glycosyltransferase family 2 protein n=1 Tax=uncultured Bacteroides sp. TaxID=162156 RepID=UPI0025DCAA11|nr:glycosyltransferase family 2 protein [uncultured Bacteroides sp.]